MNALERNLNIISDIVDYCDKIAKSIQRFGDYYVLTTDDDYKNSVSMSVLQIGELSGRLTEDFKDKYNGVPWREIKAMRNIVTHEYPAMEIDILWQVISEHVSELCRYCEEILRENGVEEY